MYRHSSQGSGYLILSFNFLKIWKMTQDTGLKIHNWKYDKVISFIDKLNCYSA